MPITLSYDGTTVSLPEDLYWADEFNWTALVQTAERTITGALIIQQATRIAGRPVTLQPDGDSGWIPRGVLEQLRTWATIPQCEMTLTHRGVTRQVIWRHHEGDVIDANPVVHYADAQSGDWYTATLRLMEI